MTESLPSAICPICGSTTFVARKARLTFKCARCGANERTRLMHLLLDQLEFPKPGMRVLHLAPERTLARRLQAVLGDGYEMADYDPSLFPWAPDIRALDLTRDAATLPTGHFDAILHLHVMEHVPCNITAVLFHLHRALKPDGLQICSIPIVPNRRWEESLEPLDRDDATARFGQYDHVRRFGAEDLALTLGMIFDLPDEYDLSALVPETTLRAHGFDEPYWRGWSPNSLLVLPRSALKLDPARQPAA